MQQIQTPSARAVAGSIQCGHPFTIIMANHSPFSDHRDDHRYAAIVTDPDLQSPQIWLNATTDPAELDQIIQTAMIALPSLELPVGRDNPACPFCAHSTVLNKSMSRHVTGQHLHPAGIDWNRGASEPYRWESINPVPELKYQPPPKPEPIDPATLLSPADRSRSRYETRISPVVRDWLSDTVAIEGQPAFWDHALTRMMLISFPESRSLAAMMTACDRSRIRQYVPFRPHLLSGVRDAWIERWPYLFDGFTAAASIGCTAAAFWALYERHPEQLTHRFPHSADYTASEGGSDSDVKWFNNSVATYAASCFDGHSPLADSPVIARIGRSA